MWRGAGVSLVLATATLTAAPAPGVRMLVPGFTVHELPVQLTSLNNIEYAPDGRLFAGGYDGRYHVLRDTDGDGLEDRVDTFHQQPSPNYPLGIAVKDGEPYFVLSTEVIRFRDLDADGIPETREVFATGFEDPELAKARYLLHRRVDHAMALAFGPDGALYLTMGGAAYRNPYWTDEKTGVNHYATDRRRGCLLRIAPDGRVEQLASGLRYIMSLQWNRHGDLFATEQEGATWVPNGNPFDELLHLQPGRHYGFPPRHPVHLPHVVDEPSVWDYRPQHQSTCGFRFNGPLPGRGRFGPEFWADDALVTGESRGKLYRTKLARTAAGYVARNDLIAAIGHLAVDCAISPRGDLLVACHTGKPDWGNGPVGEGKLYKISFTAPTAPQPVLAWAASPTETVVAFDRPLEAAAWRDAAARTIIDSGRHVAAADRWETLRPGYAVVKAQLNEPRGAVAVRAARLAPDRQTLVLTTSPRVSAVNYALAVRDGFDLAHDLTGVAAEWRGRAGGRWTGWLPHPDFAAAREFTRASAMHDEFWRHSATAGTLTLRAQLDLWQMLQPATQPGAQLDYEPEPETVTLTFAADATLAVEAPGARVERVGEREVRVTVEHVKENAWQPFTLTLATPATRLDVGYRTRRDDRVRAPGIARFVLPFARPGATDLAPRVLPELAGADWHAGRALFNGKAACATCHELRGEGKAVGPDLSNLVHRDYASVLADIVDPNASINPDAVGYVVTLKDNSTVIGTNVGESALQLHLAQPGGEVAKLRKADIARVEPMTHSLMPPGLERNLTAAELRDLMAFLLTIPSSTSP
jgi:putative heme-binding domain-containing protein